ncbi:MAG: type IV pilus twitching motility protein PilT [Gemmatimonadaceae bacterium]
MAATSAGAESGTGVGAGGAAAGAAGAAGARIDRLLQALVDASGEEVHLRSGEKAYLVRGGTEHAVTREPLTYAQVLMLLSEPAPSDARMRLAEATGQATVFELAGPGGRYTVAARCDGSSCDARIRPAETAASAPNGDRPERSNGAGPAADPQRKAAIDVLLRALVERKASDLHLRTGAVPLLRLDGELVAAPNAAALGAGAIQGMLAAIMNARIYADWAASHDADFAYELPGVARFRVNAFVDRHGPAAVFRAIPAKLVTAEELRLSSEVQALCQLSKGLVLVTGPTGSGKSTTLCALVDLVNRTRRDHIITIEDPIEFVHESKGCLVSQRQVGMHTGSFKQALRAALREDPDVVLVGELRDLETMAIAIETAETGHLVFGTLHTTTAASTIDRIIDQFPADRQEQVRVLLSESVKGIISQVLCRKVGGGRVAAMEVLLSTPALANLIREAKTFQIPSVMQTSRRLGMVTQSDALLDLVAKGLIEPREAYLKATDRGAVVQGLKAKGHETAFAEPESPPNAGRGSAATRQGTPTPSRPRAAR